MNHRGRKGNKKRWLALVGMLLLTVLLSLQAFAFGDSIDHDNDFTIGGDSDSSDWDYSGNGGDGFFFFGGSGDGSGGSILIGALIFAAIVILVVVMNQKKGKSGGKAAGPIQMADSSRVDSASLAKLREADPSFSEAAMLSKVENLFVTIQLAWSNMDYEPVRPFLSNALYEQHAKQLEDKKARDERNLSSEMSVLQSKLESYYSDGHAEYLNVWLRVKLKDYVVKFSDPNQIVRGSKDKTYYLDYRWQLTRSAGGKTEADTDGVKTGECPNCGASINMNQSGKCPYCDTVISTTEYDWVLSKVDRLQQISR